MLLSKLLKKYRYINNMKKLLILSSISLLATLMMTPTWADNHASGPAKTEASTTAAATLYIISPKDGDEVTSPVTVVFGLKGMGVAPAGIEKDNTGHHHLLIDQKELPTEGIPMGADVKHFGGGQTQADVELSSGEHTLQLILGDMAHVPLSPALTSEKITIKVK